MSPDFSSNHRTPKDGDYAKTFGINKSVPHEVQFNSDSMKKLVRNLKNQENFGKLI